MPTFDQPHMEKMLVAAEPQIRMIWSQIVIEHMVLDRLEYCNTAKLDGQVNLQCELCSDTFRNMHDIEYV